VTESQSSRDKILDVAEALFAQRGYAGVGLRQVAEAAGLVKSSLFHHFRSKAQLYAEVLGRVLVRIRERLDPVLESGTDPEQKLDRWVDALIDALAEHPTTARLLLRGLFEEDDFRADPVLESGSDPEGKLDRWVDALIDALAEHPTTARLLLRGLFEEDDFRADPVPEAAEVDELIAAILDGIQRLLKEGVDAGAFRAVSVPHTVQTLIGATVYHFASGGLGEGLLGRPLLSAEAVRRRKQELGDLLHHGIAGASRPRARSASEGRS